MSRWEGSRAAAPLLKRVRAGKRGSEGSKRGGEGRGVGEQIVDLALINIVDSACTSSGRRTYYKEQCALPCLLLTEIEPWET